MQTPGGYTMSVATASCGALGWVSDAHGYRYAACDPLSGRPWPAMPECFLELAGRAAAEAGFADFQPEACLINQYEPGAKLSLHQDRDEKDLSAPIVSLSLGLPAVFLFGGAERSQRPQRLRLVHGDVVVWGGPARLAFHGVAPLADGDHPLLGQRRINLTFRQVQPPSAP
jgi:alkylated DNA repair protein (DNA oxidative demethylase)